MRKCYNQTFMHARHLCIYFLMPIGLVLLFAPAFGEKKSTDKDGYVVLPRTLKTSKQQQFYLQHLIDSAFRFNNNALAASAYSRMASLRYREGYYHLAISYFIKSNDYARLSKNKNLIAINYNSIGSAYRQHDELKDAFIYHKKSIETAVEVGNLKTKGFALNGIGNIYLSLNQPDKAINILNESLEIAYSRKDLLSIAINTANLGDAYAKKKNLKKALNYYFKSLNINKKLKNKRGIRICHSDICITYLEAYQPQKAIEYAQAALSESGETAPVDSANFYLAIAKIYFAQKDYATSVTNALKAAKIGYRIGSKNTSCRAYKSLATIYQHMNKREAYLNAFEQSLKYQDSVSQEHANREIAELQLVSEIEKRDSKIKQLIVENRIKDLEQSKSDHTLIIVVLCSTLALILTFLFSRKITNKAIQTSNDFELKLLHSQINPHFIFNSLNSIQKFIWSNNPEHASLYLSNFSMLMRKTMESLKQDLTPLSKDFEHLRLYLELEKQRLSDGFEYEINLPEKADPENIAIPPLAIQPFVENAIWHGIAPVLHKNKGIISISCSLDKNFLVVQVEDNGIGINSSKTSISTIPKNHESAGMKITAERLKIAHKVNKIKNVNYIKITDVSELDPSRQGTIATILIPYKEIY